MNLHLHFFQSPGDSLAGEASIASLKILCPEYQIEVSGTCCDAIYAHNPNVTKLKHIDKRITMSYPLVDNSNQRHVHLMHGYAEYLGGQLGCYLPLMVNAPRLYLSEEERQEKAKTFKYWLVNAGTKQDYTVKGWGNRNYQAVVDALQGRIRFVQIGEAGHLHKGLEGVENMLGRTSTRELIRLAYHSEGGIGGVTFLMHVYAALGKPYVCIASGMERPSWYSYPGQRVLNRSGCLPCCAGGNGCWRSRVVPLGDGDGKDRSLCALAVVEAGEAIPRCMDMIEASEVVRAVESYYAGGLL